MQLGVSGIQKNQPFEAGEIIRFRLQIRNAGEQPLQFRYHHPKTAAWTAPRIKHENGTEIRLRVMRFRGGHRTYSETLKPDEMVTLKVAGVLVVGEAKQAAKNWPRFKDPAPGKYELQAGYLIQPLDSTGKPIVESGRVAKHLAVQSGIVPIQIH